MSKRTNPRVCVLVGMPYDAKRREQPQPHLLLRSSAASLDAYVAELLTRLPPFVLKKQSGTFYFGLETDEQLTGEENTRRWTSAFGTSLEVFLRQHLEPLFPAKDESATA